MFHTQISVHCPSPIREAFTSTMWEFTAHPSDGHCVECDFGTLSPKENIFIKALPFQASGICVEEKAERLPEP